LKPCCVSLGDLHYISLFSTYSGAYLLKDEILGGPLMGIFYKKGGWDERKLYHSENSS
jgi:hypothetical protein